MRTVIICLTLLFWSSIETVLVSPSYGDDVSVKWDDNCEVESNFTGYRVYKRDYPDGEYDYANPIWSGTSTHADLIGIDPGCEFVVVAVYTDGISYDSNKLIYIKGAPSLYECRFKKTDGKLVHGGTGAMAQR